MPDLGLSSAILLSRDLTPFVRFAIVAGICVLACSFLFTIAAIHMRRLRRIPIRIHVAGTRGKSSTVRLIAAGFRTAGFTVVAKVTGTEPVIILPDGSERKIARWGAPAIREQRDFIAVANRIRANVIVAEAMAIQPEYLDALERFYIRATDLVVTNVRPDHQEQLGTAPDAMAEAIATAIPRKGRLFLSDEAAVPAILQRATDIGAEAIQSPKPDKGSDPELANFNLAAEVWQRYGIQVEKSFEAMRKTASEIGSFRFADFPEGAGRVRFANAFSCNDAEFFVALWHHHQPADMRSAFFLSPRTDRPIRTRELLTRIAQLTPDANLFIASGNFLLRRMAQANGFAPERIHMVSRTPTTSSLRVISERLKEPTILWGIGNFKGTGARLIRILEGPTSQC